MARKEKKYHFIYKTTNLLSGRYYIGMHSTDNMADGYMGSGKRLRYSINKYGKENHKVEVLEFLNNRKELIQREKEIVTLNELAKKECMNLMPGGTGGFISEEHQRKAGKIGGSKFSEKIKNDSEFRKKYILNVSKNIANLHKLGKYKYDKFKGKKHSKETKNKISESMQGIGVGEKNSQYGTCWITKNGVNKKINKKEINLWTDKDWKRGREK